MGSDSEQFLLFDYRFSMRRFSGRIPLFGKIPGTSKIHFVTFFFQASCLLLRSLYSPLCYVR